MRVLTRVPRSRGRTIVRLLAAFLVLPLLVIAGPRAAHAEGLPRIEIDGDLYIPGALTIVNAQPLGYYVWTVYEDAGCTQEDGGRLENEQSLAALSYLLDKWVRVTDGVPGAETAASICMGPFGPEPPAFQAKPDVSITGTPKVGQTLSAQVSGGTPAAAETSKTYSWLVDGVERGTGSTYDVQPDDLGKLVTVVVTSSLAEWKDDETTSAAFGPIAQGTQEAVPVQIQGIVAVGETIQCATPAPNPSYEWLMGQQVVGNGPALQVEPSHAGQTLTCRATVTRSGYEDAVGTESVEVPLPSLDLELPLVDMFPRVGEQSTCTFLSSYDSFVMVWKRGTETVGAGSTYTPTSDDVGHVLTCEVTASEAGYADTTTSADSNPVAKGTFTTGAPTVVPGVPAVGLTLTCSMSPGPGTPSFTWLVDGVRVADGPTYQPTAADVGLDVACAMVVDRPGYEPSRAIAVAGPVEKGTFDVPAPVVTGAARVGETLVCSMPGIARDVTYLWLRGDGRVMDTGPVHLVTAAELGEELTCHVTVQQPGYETGTAGAIVGPVETGAASTYEVDFGEQFRIGRSIRARVDAPEGAVVDWQWFSRGGPIPGATEPILPLTPDLYGLRVTAVATVHVLGYKESRASARSARIDLQRLKITTERGAVRAGETIEVTVTNLLPGQRWELRFASGELVARGRAPADSQTMVRTVQMSADPDRLGERHLAVRTSDPDRVAWTPLRVLE